jgi:hypothetical protein
MHRDEPHATMQESLRKWAENHHLGLLPASVAAEVVAPARDTPLPGLPPEAAVAHLSPEQVKLIPRAVRDNGRGGAVTSWSSDGEGWQTRGCAEWSSSPAGTGRVAKTPRPADSARSTRIGGGPRAAAAAVERRRRRRSMNRVPGRRCKRVWRRDTAHHGRAEK